MSITGHGDKFGTAVSMDADTIVVGAPSEDSSHTGIIDLDNDIIDPDPPQRSAASDDEGAQQAGAVYVFIRSGVQWSAQGYLKAPNAGASDEFGHALAIHGDTIVVGAPKESSDHPSIANDGTGSEDNGASETGAAYVYVRSGSWTSQAYLKAPNPDISDKFGESVAISGDTIVVGARYEDSSHFTNRTTNPQDEPAAHDNSSEDSGFLT